jgi:hypothetical protein
MVWNELLLMVGLLICVGTSVGVAKPHSYQ